MRKFIFSANGSCPRTWQVASRHSILSLLNEQLLVIGRIMELELTGPRVNFLSVASTDTAKELTVAQFHLKGQALALALGNC